jgi:hypothetical protein
VFRWVRVFRGSSRRFRDGPDGDLLGPPDICTDHVPVPPPEPRSGFSAVGGFGRGALGPLPPEYPSPQSRLVLRDLRLLVQLCCDPKNPPDGTPRL